MMSARQQGQLVLVLPELLLLVTPPVLRSTGSKKIVAVAGAGAPYRKMPSGWPRTSRCRCAWGSRPSGSRALGAESGADVNVAGVGRAPSDAQDEVARLKARLKNKTRRLEGAIFDRDAIRAEYQVLG
ncbi:hypothetical protein Esi_0061_0023 [Ectocarpus siliculosus]|uniref:Uncharacterized protein n=1 Tax=Ectocarpus siliculosus TaxID=2880 RepID=D8LQW9_ECTSI|nr:hypothetical protein Esi_0061_0023 [Ectocarpus siliculosus]|eukprot:CBN77642.1 hypothetical protein Esi_0061_0023 [Ectocarpus siliculosus]